MHRWIGHITDAIIQIIIDIIEIIPDYGIIIEQIHVVFDVGCGRCRCRLIHVDGGDNFHKNHFDGQDEK